MVIPLSVGCSRPDAAVPERDPADDVRQLMQEKVKSAQGRSLNQMSPETVASLVPRLRVGMAHAELHRILAEKNGVDRKTGQHIGTVEFSRGMVWLMDEQGKPLRDEKGELRPDPEKWYCVIHVRDANLRVVFDKDDRVLSWSAEPLPQR
jgi:hypothetical protein